VSVVADGANRRGAISLAPSATTDYSDRSSAYVVFPAFFYVLAPLHKILSLVSIGTTNRLASLSYGQYC